MRANGADERIFIQDESLPLRLAAYSRKYLKLKAPVMFIPLIEGQLSGNRAQLTHDRFLAHYYMLQDYPALSPLTRALLFQRCVSAAWKQAQQQGVSAYFSRAFSDYVLSQAKLLPESPEYLAKLKAMFDHLPNVRRIQEHEVTRVA